MKTWYIDKPTHSIADVMEVDWKLKSLVLKGYLITRINVPYVHRGKKIATKLLKEIVADADADGVTLYLEPVPTGDLGYKELRAWYSRHGFKPWKGLMRRLPR